MVGWDRTEARRGREGVKIGIVCYPTYGGSGAVATELGLGLAELGHEVHFMSYAPPFRLSGFRERVYFHEVEMEDYPLFEHPPYSLALAVSIHQVAGDHGLDLVHVHYAIPHATSAWLAGQMFGLEDRPRIITTLHGTDITLLGQHPSFRSITRFSILKSDGLTAVSDYLREETRRNFDVNVDRLRVIPNFIDTEIYRRDREPCHRAKFANDDEKLLMHVSNFRPVKRVEDVVGIFAKVSREMPSRLVMVGDGPDRVRAQQRAEELDVSDRVVFLGKHLSVDEVLACADLFLLPSESESFGLAALEAMSCGTPVVASRVGGLPEVVEDGGSGRLFPAGDVESMANGVVEILSSKDRWRAMSHRSREIALTKFSATAIVEVYEDFYREVLDASVPGQGSSLLSIRPAGSLVQSDL